jgi:hypothetical protein
MVADDKKSLVLNVSDVLNDNQSSVKLSRTTKGTTWEIKVYNADPNRAFEIADNIYGKCISKYGAVEV